MVKTNKKTKANKTPCMRATGGIQKKTRNINNLSNMFSNLSGLKGKTQVFIRPTIKIKKSRPTPRNSGNLNPQKTLNTMIQGLRKRSNNKKKQVKTQATNLQIAKLMNTLKM